MDARLPRAADKLMAVDVQETAKASGATDTTAPLTATPDATPALADTAEPAVQRATPATPLTPAQAEASPPAPQIGGKATEAAVKAPHPGTSGATGATAPLIATPDATPASADTAGPAVQRATPASPLTPAQADASSQAPQIDGKLTEAAVKASHPAMPGATGATAPLTATSDAAATLADAPEPAMQRQAAAAPAEPADVSGFAPKGNGTAATAVSPGASREQDRAPARAAPGPINQDGMARRAQQVPTPPMRAEVTNAPRRPLSLAFAELAAAGGIETSAQAPRTADRALAAPGVTPAGMARTPATLRQQLLGLGTSGTREAPIMAGAVRPFAINVAEPSAPPARQGLASSGIEVAKPAAQSSASGQSAVGTTVLSGMAAVAGLVPPARPGVAQARGAESTDKPLSEGRSSPQGGAPLIAAGGQRPGASAEAAARTNTQAGSASAPAARAKPALAGKSDDMAFDASLKPSAAGDGVARMPPAEPMPSQLGQTQLAGPLGTAGTAAAAAVGEAPIRLGHPGHALPATPSQTPRLDTAALGLTIGREVQAGRKTFEILLDPPELGRVEVRVEFHRDGRVSTNLVVDRPDALEALVRDARALERALTQSGFTVDRDGLSFQLRDQGGFAGGHGRQAHDGTAEQSPGGDRPSDFTEETTPSQPQQASRGTAKSGLDLRI
ncbi:flagellar hook-length control protein FliK [Lutibaculum baratangense]|nr:flagellar hook-length control protein FliK [Lutibaculum baratangense]